MQAVADPETSEGGPRNMKYKLPPGGGHLSFGLFLQARGGGMAPLAPPGSATGKVGYWMVDT